MRQRLLLHLVLLLSLPARAQAVNLLTLADWGSGRSEQKQVAQAMARYAASINQPFHAALLAGDNFYGKLKSTTDKRWDKEFERAYDKTRLDFPFYAVAGNHDYESTKVKVQMAYARENPASRWKFPARWYRVDLPADKPIVTILMLDSNKDKLGADWLPEKRWIDDQLADVAREFGPRHWTVAVAHHPLFSNGSHGDNRVLQAEWGPLFRKHKLHFYVAGHDHDLQHLELPALPETSFVLTGGGGAKTRGLRRDNRGPFSTRAYGFTHFQFTTAKATVRIIDINGHTLHAFDKTPDGQTTVRTSTPSDPATKPPQKAPQGFGDNKND